MQLTLDRWQRKGQGIDDDWLRRLGPAHFAHVNFRGTLSFPVDRYREMSRCRSVATNHFIFLPLNGAVRSSARFWARMTHHLKTPMVVRH